MTKQKSTSTILSQDTTCSPEGWSNDMICSVNGLSDTELRAREKNWDSHIYTYLHIKLKPCWHANKQKCIRPEISWICWSVSCSGWRAFKRVCVRQNHLRVPHCAWDSMLVMKAIHIQLLLLWGLQHASSSRSAISCFQKDLYIYIIRLGTVRCMMVYDGIVRMRGLRHCVSVDWTKAQVTSRY